MSPWWGPSLEGCPPRRPNETWRTHTLHPAMEETCNLSRSRTHVDIRFGRDVMHVSLVIYSMNTQIYCTVTLQECHGQANIKVIVQAPHYWTIGNPSATDGCSSQRASNARNISMSWRHHSSVASGSRQQSIVRTLDLCQGYRFGPTSALVNLTLEVI